LQFNAQILLENASQLTQNQKIEKNNNHWQFLFLFQNLVWGYKQK